jgi:hypothetical protein
MALELGDVRYWMISGKHMFALSFSGFDPSATLAVRCGNDFDADFGPYQTTDLSGYDIVFRAWGRP